MMKRRSLFLMKKKKTILFLLIIISIFVYPLSTYANGWVEKNHSAQIYGKADSPSSAETPADVKDMGAVEKYFVQMIVRGGDKIVEFFNAQTIPLSIDGIVLGRLANGIDTSYVKFELAKNNPWGIMGAIVYKTLAGGIIGFYLLSFLVNMGKYLLKSNSAREMAGMKEYIYNFVFWFFILFVGYMIVDWILYVIDVFIYNIQKHFGALLGITDTSAAISLISIFKTEADTGVISALMYLASVCSGLFFIGNYVGTAIIQMSGFGAMPVVCIRATNNKRAFSMWADIFGLNMFIPLIDSVLLLVPGGFYTIVKAVDGQTAADSFSVSFVRLLIIWAIIPSRNMILRMFGGGAAPVNGMRGLAAMAMMAAKTMGGGIKRGSKDISGGHSFRDDMEKGKLAQEQADTLADVNTLASSGMGDINDMLSGNGNVGGSNNVTTDGFGSFDGAADGEMPNGAMENDSELEDMISGGESNGMSDGDLYTATGLGEEDDIPSANDLNDDQIDIGTAEELDMDDMEEIPDTESGEDLIAAEEIRSDNVANEMELDPEAAIDPEAPINSEAPLRNQDIVDADRNSDADIPADNLETPLSETQDMEMSGEMNENSPYQNIPNMDSEFANSLEGADLDRYANLNARDALTEELNQNKGRLNEIDEAMTSDASSMARMRQENATLSGQNEEIEASNDVLQQEIASLQSRNAAIDTNRMMEGQGEHGAEAPYTMSVLSGEVEKERNMSAIAEKMDQLDRNNAVLDQNRAKMDSNQHQIEALESRAHGYRAENAQIRSQNQRLQNGIDNCTAREQQYADNAAAAGMGRKSYQDARAFQSDKIRKDRLQEKANYKNFESDVFKDSLTPEQRAKFYRERAIKGAISRTAKTAAKAGAAITVGTVGAAAMTYGGPSSMLAGAVVGADAGTKTVDAAGKVASTSGRVIRNTSNAVATGAKNIASFVQSESDSTESVPKNKKIPQGVSRANVQKPVNKGINRDVGKDLREAYRKEVAEMEHQYDLNNRENIGNDASQNVDHTAEDKGEDLREAYRKEAAEMEHQYDLEHEESNW